MAAPRFDDIQGEDLPPATRAPRFDEIEGEDLAADGAPEISAGRAATLGVAQGGTMGFSDEIGGMIGSLFVPESTVRPGAAAMPSDEDTLDELQAKGDLLQNVAETPTSYELVRNRMRAEQKQAKEQQGGAYMAGEIAGGVAGSVAGNILLPGGGAIARSAAEGAVGGLGSSEADLLKGEYGQAALDTATGAAVGGAAGFVGGAIAKRLPGAARATQEGLESAAQGRAVKAATGQNKRAISKMIQAGELGLDTGTVERVGSDLLNEGVVDAGASARDILKRAAERKEAWGATIGETLGYLDNAGAAVHIPSLADDMERALVLPLQGGTYGDRQIATRLANELQAFRDQGEEVGLVALDAFKRRLDRSIKYNATEMPAASEALLRMRTMLNEAIESKADEVAQAIGAPEVAQLFKEAKAVWSSMNIGEKVAKNQASAQASNRFVSPSDYGVGAAAALLSTGNPLGAAVQGAASALGHRVVRTRGNQVAASALRGLSGNALLRTVAESSPEALGRFAGPITAAAARGEPALAAADYVLQQTDPEYRALKERLAKEAE